MSSFATDSALTFWDLDTRRSGPTIPANVTSASWSARNLFVGNWLAKPVVNSTCASPAWNGVRQVLPRVQGLSGLHCSNTRMAHIYSTFCACRPFLLTGASVDRPETRVLFSSHSPLMQAPSRPSTAPAKLPAAYQSGWCVVRKDGSGPMEPPHKRRQRAITSGSIHTSATAGKRLRGGTTRQTNKAWNISRFAWVISCRRMTRRTRNAKTSTSVRRLSFGSWS